MLKATLVGQFRIVLDDKPVELTSRPAQTLLAYLLLNRGIVHRREQLAGLLWPDSLESTARKNLRNAVWQLRKAIGERYVLTDKETVAFNADAPYDLDIAALARETGETDAEALIAAVSAYKGELLPGFYEDWVQLERERLRALFERRIQALLDGLAAAARWPEAHAWAEHWIAQGHVPEPAYRALMLACAARGDLAGVATAYRRCVQALKEELDVSPSAETRALYERLSRGEALDVVAGTPRTPETAVDPAQRYIEQELLAVGGHGQVYRGRDSVTGQPVVIKRLQHSAARQPELAARFVREGELLRQLDHPNIVKVLATFEREGQHAIVLEHMPGGTLQDLLASKTQLPVERILEVGLELADALSRTHHLGVIHRDLKPGNVLLAADGTPRLTDFGLARFERQQNARLTQAGMVVGSPIYMSPEALQNQELDARSDIWSFGVLLYEMLASQAPFEGEDLAPLIARILHEPVPAITQFRPDTPAPLADLIHRMLVKDRGQRVSSMRQVAAELEAIKAGRVIEATPYPQSRQTPGSVPSRHIPATRSTPGTAEGRPSPPPGLAVRGRRAGQQIRFCTSPDGVRLAYATVGQGPPLVKAAHWLSHLEFDWNSPVWRHWLIGLSEQHTLIRYDQRGCGLSDWEAEDLSVDAFVQDLETLVDALGLERFPLLGISGGGAVAIAYAVRHPEKVSHLILYGAYSAGRNSRTYLPQEIEKAKTMLGLIKVGWGQDNPAFRQFFTTLFMPEATAEQASWFNDLQRVSTSPEMAYNLQISSYDRDVRDLLPRVTTPTLILHSREEAVVPFDEGRRLAAQIPQARFVPLESKNHILLEIEPAWPRFLDEVHQFLQTEPEAPPSRMSRDVTPSSRRTPSMETGPTVRHNLPGQPTPFIGRETELAQLDAWLKAALAGTRQFVFITGESGLGKTTLVNAFLAEARDKAALWIGHGQCLEHQGAGEAYMPVLEALGRMGQEPGGHTLITLLAQRAPTWLVQMPWLVSAGEFEALQHKVLGATPKRMLREMVEAIEALTAQRPLVLVLEDLHWSDHATVDLLAWLARRQDPARLLLIGTYRPADVKMRDHPLHAVVQELMLRRQCAELALPFLTETGVSAYLAARFPGATLPAGLTRLLHQRTDGNPLFMRDVADAWIAQGALVEVDGQWVIRAGLEVLAVGTPENLRQLIERQIGQFNPQDREILEAASVAGMEFSAAAVAAGGNCTEEEAETRCAALARRGQFLRPSGTAEWADGTVAARFGFIHHLYQTVLYDQVPAGRQVRLHRQIGVRLEAGYGRRAPEMAAELAMHFVRGREARRAIQYLQFAAEHALKRGAPRQAVQHLTEALHLLHDLPETPERVQIELTLQTMLAPALITSEGWASSQAERAYRRAQDLSRQLGTPGSLAAALFGMATMYELRGEYQKSQALLEETLQLPHDSQDHELVLESHELLACSTFHQGAFSQALIHAERGLTIYDFNRQYLLLAALGENPGVSCHDWAALAQWFLGYPEKALGTAGKALRLSQDHLYSLAYAQTRVAWLHQCRREEKPTQKWAEAAITLATERGFPLFLAMGTILRGWALAAQGKCEEGIEQLHTGLAACRKMGVAMDHPYFLALLAEAYHLNGEPEKGLNALAEALAAVRSSRAFFYEADLYRLKGELLRKAEQGRGNVSPGLLDAPPEACFLKAVEIARQQGSKLLELRAAVSLSRLWREQGKAAEARQILVEIYGWFTEGYDTADLQEARSLIEALGGAEIAQRSGGALAPRHNRPAGC
jgi:serine/threonine protein kinase/type II secretory pathway predicted ATPase ExeA